MRSVLRHRLLLLLLLLSTAPATALAQGGLNRCVDAQGHTVYTDQRCEDVGALPRGATPGSAGAGAGTMAAGAGAPGCARTPEALARGLRAALEAGDVNGLAAFYHWSGTGRGGARRLMDALEAVAARPLLAVRLDYGEAPGEATGDTGLPAMAPATSAGYEATATPRRPVALRLRQMRGPKDPTEVETAFALARNAGCWWIHF